MKKAKSLIKDDSLYLSYDYFLDSNIVVGIGINSIQDHLPVSFYISNIDNSSLVQLAAKITEYSDTECKIEYLNNNLEKWGGAPYILKIEQIDNEDWIEITPWIFNYSPFILKEAYQTVASADNDTDLEKEIAVVSTFITDTKNLPEGAQFSGYIKNGEYEEQPVYSVKHTICLIKLSEEPMVGRIGDQRVGYFYNNTTLDHLVNKRTGEPSVIINKRSVKKAPWTYVIDNQTIPLEYHEAIKKGILSWNATFKKLKLGEPIVVKSGHEIKTIKQKGGGDQTCKNKCMGLTSGGCLSSQYGGSRQEKEPGMDIFDTKYNYVVGTNVKKFNGPYMGYSQYIIDPRSGEILFGNISLNLVKIKANPARYFKVIFEKDSENESLKSSIDKYLMWVAAHEMGHQLGLRHNFMGVTTNKGYGSVMDYIDLFFDFENFKKLSITDKRSYDYKAIQYGYTVLENEKTGIKHPKLDNIIKQMPVFGTDENMSEDINPLVNVNTSGETVLGYIEKAIPYYKKQRENLLKLIESKKITPFEHNSLIIYLYTNRYPEIAHYLLKYIGGRINTNNRNMFKEISKEDSLKALNLLLVLLDNAFYTPKEYSYLVYEPGTSNETYGFSPIEVDNFYGLNSTNMFNLYQSFVDNIFEKLMDPERLYRIQQSKEISVFEIFMNFSFNPGDLQSVDDSDEKSLSSSDLLSIDKIPIARDKSSAEIFSIKYRGIFPEIGAWLVQNQDWQDILLKNTYHYYNIQYTWLTGMLKQYRAKKLYLISKNFHQIIILIGKVGNTVFIPFLKSYGNTELLNHWNLLLQIITDRFKYKEEERDRESAEEKENEESEDTMY